MKLIALGEVCTLINGGTPDTKNSKFWDGKHAWITPAEMGNLKSPFLGSSRRTLTDEGMRNSSAQLLPKHSVIMSSRAPIGHLIINEVPMASNQGCKGLIPNETLNFKYLYYFLYANKEYLNELGSGTTFAEISGAKLKTVLIPLPSLDEQLNIVKKLDSAFANIDLLEENLGSSEIKTNELLQSLLSSAFSSNKAQIDFTKVFTVIPDSKSKIKSSSYLESGKYAVVDQGKELVAGYTDTSPTVDKKSLPVIVFGDHTRAVKYIDFPFTAGADGTQILKPSALTNPKYGFYLVLHAVGQIPSKGYARHFGELKKMQFQLPSLPEQRKIVEKLDSVFAEIEVLKAQIKIEQDHATALRQSLLSNAFTREEAVA